MRQTYRSRMLRTSSPRVSRDSQKPGSQTYNFPEKDWTGQRLESWPVQERSAAGTGRVKGWPPALSYLRQGVRPTS